MFLFSEPEIPLRMRRCRGVLNGALVDEADSLEHLNFKPLLAFARKFSEGIDPGYVDTLSPFAGITNAFNDSMDRVACDIHERLNSYGFVLDYNEHEVRENLQVMTTRGATPHADCYNSDWDKALFWVYVLRSKDADLWFGNLGLRVPLRAGQLIVFDPGQPHAVVAKDQAEFREADFPDDKKQFYVCGHLSYASDFWRDLGVSCDPAELEAQGLIDVATCKINERTARVRPTKLS